MRRSVRVRWNRPVADGRSCHRSRGRSKPKRPSVRSAAFPGDGRLLANLAAVVRNRFQVRRGVPDSWQTTHKTLDRRETRRQRGEDGVLFGKYRLERLEGEHLIHWLERRK